MAGEAYAFEAEFTVRDQVRARRENEELRGRTFLTHDDRSWSWGQYCDESTRVAHFIKSRLGKIDDAHPGHVAMLLENHLELSSLYGGCAINGSTLFGINSGLRGEVLAGVINQSRSRLLVVDERSWPEAERVLDQLETVPRENVLVLRSGSGDFDASMDYRACLDSEMGPATPDLEFPDVEVTPETNLMIIYTSGTTGLPKGINNNHLKLCMIGAVVSDHLGLGRDDCGYACMPLFHSNAMFIGFMPSFWVGARMALRERFSASKFVPDVIGNGVTFWNYVGEPVHYVLRALEKQYDGDLDRIRAEVTEHPDNVFRYAVGNGAAPPDIDRFIDWMGLEDMFELYGSTEAAISTFRKLGDPRGSVGQVTDPAVKIIGEDGNECPPAELDSDGKIANYDDAVGEICRVAEDTSLFQGYYENDDANSSKYRDGVYHSGDLGHILERDGDRFLFFDGRTDDWIRKDGENFSAMQVSRLISEHPDFPLAAAYGVPCSVSDELVMAAVKMREGVEFDPQSLFDYCEQQIEHGGMDRKWFPDFVRVVDDFEYTGTQKILVRNLKADHYHPERVPGSIYWRERGDAGYKPLADADWQRLRSTFEAAERLDLLDR
ncbi:MAG: AMP-binding protein [Proteobacteria bacterium]|nr:AMP-binding protein [Pseudomonadota bacterium]